MNTFALRENLELGQVQTKSQAFSILSNSLKWKSVNKKNSFILGNKISLKIGFSPKLTHHLKPPPFSLYSAGSRNSPHLTPPMTPPPAASTVRRRWWSKCHQTNHIFLFSFSIRIHKPKLLIPRQSLRINRKSVKSLSFSLLFKFVEFWAPPHRKSCICW